MLLPNTFIILFIFSPTCFQTLSHAKTPQWPPGTNVNASSVYPPESPPQKGSFEPSLAIDGDDWTYWRDATNGSFPDIIRLFFPFVLSLDDVSLAGPLIITNWTLNGLCYTPATSSYENLFHIGNNPTFDHIWPLDCSQIEIVVYDTTAPPFFRHTEIAEIVPRYVEGRDPNERKVVGTSSSTAPGSSTAPVSSSSPDHPSSTLQNIPDATSVADRISHSQNLRTAIGIFSTFGVLILLLVIALSLHRIRRRKIRGQPQIWERWKSRASDTGPKAHEMHTETLREELSADVVRKAVELSSDSAKGVELLGDLVQQFELDTTETSSGGSRGELRFEFTANTAEEAKMLSILGQILCRPSGKDN